MLIYLFPISDVIKTSFLTTPHQVTNTNQPNNSTRHGTGGPRPPRRLRHLQLITTASPDHMRQLLTAQPSVPLRVSPGPAHSNKNPCRNPTPSPRGPTQAFHHSGPHQMPPQLHHHRQSPSPARPLSSPRPIPTSHLPFPTYPLVTGG